MPWTEPAAHGCQQKYCAFGHNYFQQKYHGTVFDMNAKLLGILMFVSHSVLWCVFIRCYLRLPLTQRFCNSSLYTGRYHAEHVFFGCKFICIRQKGEVLVTWIKKADMTGSLLVIGVDSWNNLCCRDRRTSVLKDSTVAESSSDGCRWLVIKPCITGKTFDTDSQISVPKVVIAHFSACSTGIISSISCHGFLEVKAVVLQTIWFDCDQPRRSW